LEEAVVCELKRLLSWVTGEAPGCPGVSVPDVSVAVLGLRLRGRGGPFGVVGRTTTGGAGGAELRALIVALALASSCPQTKKSHWPLLMALHRKTRSKDDKSITLVFVICSQRRHSYVH
jgi:hypothetical protein